MNIFFCHQGHASPMAHHFFLEVGKLHYFFLHFPIALIYMAVIFEILHLIDKREIFPQLSRWMVLSAAFSIVPTVLFGWILSTHLTFQGADKQLFSNHLLFAIITSLLIITTEILSEISRQKKKLRKWFIIFLFLSFIGVNITGYFGGLLTFGAS